PTATSALPLHDALPICPSVLGDTDTAGVPGSSVAVTPEGQVKPDHGHRRPGRCNLKCSGSSWCSAGGRHELPEHFKLHRPGPLRSEEHTSELQSLTQLA